MTRASPRRLLGPLCAALVCLAIWYWFPAMETRRVARVGPSFADVANPMLAAGRLLELHRHAVRAIDTLDDVALHSLPDGTLILANGGGQMPEPQAAWLMAWVERGNTLLFVPKWMRGDAAAKPGADPIGERLGVALAAGMNHDRSCDGARQDPGAAKENAPGVACLTVPGRQFALEIDSGDEILQTVGKGSAPLWSDPDGRTVRVYAQGKGHVVLLAANYFSNEKLARRDHAELLLALGELNAAARAVLIVQRLGVPHWYLALWARFQPAIIGAAICLLLLWSAARRFGPQLPEADSERRALMEHVDASGKWLWRTAAGRAILLDAARRRAELALERRAPHLLRLTPAERSRDLAHLCRLAQADVDAALFQAPARQPAPFTRQIRTLQQLRTHYER